MFGLSCSTANTRDKLSFRPSNPNLPWWYIFTCLFFFSFSAVIFTKVCLGLRANLLRFTESPKKLEFNQFSYFIYIYIYIMYYWIFLGKSCTVEVICYPTHMIRRLIYVINYDSELLLKIKVITVKWNLWLEGRCRARLALDSMVEKHS